MQDEERSEPSGSRRHRAAAVSQWRHHLGMREGRRYTFLVSELQHCVNSNFLLLLFTTQAGLS